MVRNSTALLAQPAILPMLIQPWPEFRIELDCLITQKTGTDQYQNAKDNRLAAISQK
jgi:hypothetical protein